MKAELTHLEKDLQYLYAIDYQSPNTNRQKYSRDWMLLRYGITDEGGSEGCNEQWQVVFTIRTLLKEYSECLCKCYAIIAYI
jgi:hypothetical protein